MGAYTEEKRRGSDAVVLASLTVIFVLNVLLQWYASDRGRALMGNIVLPLTCAGMGIVFARGAFARYRELLLAASFVIWYALTRMIHGNHYLMAEQFQIAMLLGCCGLVLSHSYVLDARARQRISLFVLDSILVFTVALAWVSIYSALTGEAVLLPVAKHPILVEQDAQRLRVFGIHPNAAGCIFSACAVMALYRHQISRHKLPSAILTGIAFLSFFCAVTLTDSRAAILNLAGFFAIGLVILASFRVKLKSKALKGLVLVLLAVALCVALYAANGLVRSSVTALSQRMAAEAPQDEALPTATQIAGRNPLEDASTLNGRTDIYRTVIRTVIKDPARLLLGGDQAVLMAEVNRQLKYPVDHSHNSFLEVLAVTGLPGLAIVLAFLALLAIRGVRLFASPSAAPADRIALLIPCMIVIHGMLEPLVFYCFNLVNVLFFLFCGIVFVRSREISGEM